MTQHSMNISINDEAVPLIESMNDALRALVTLSSKATEPEATFPNMLWYDSDSNILKMRSEADDGWIDMFYLDQAAGALRLLLGMQVVDATGAQKGRIDVQAGGVWNAGTGTVESLISPAKLKAAIVALAPSITAPNVSAGNTPSWGRNDDVTVSTRSGRGWQEAFVFPTLGCSGVIRVYVELNNPTVGNQATVRYRLNGNVVATSGSVSGWDNYTSDIAVSPGDVLTVETNTGGALQTSSHLMRNPQIRTSVFEPGVISPYYHRDNQFYA